MNVMAEFGMLDQSVVPPSVPPRIVEDGRPGAGHMQIQLPSPCDGFFEPIVRLGDELEAGAIVGTVTDPLGDRVEPIHAPHAGVMLVLHTFASVLAAETLGVVMETDNLNNGVLTNVSRS
jgi:predicted deacylase